MSRRILIPALLALFAFRLLYGLSNEFWFQDELQIYLIGLKYYTTGLWPYYGPDLVYTNTQIPGALQGLMVGLPFYAARIPEAPVFFLNLLSFASLALFAWYACKRIPGVPQWFVWCWTFTAPWVMIYSTRVVNPSYVLPLAIIFFISFFELARIYSKPVLSAYLAAFLMGTCTTMIMQLHLSWVLLLYLAALAFLLHFRETKKIPYLALCLYAAGLAVGAATLYPTLSLVQNSTGGTEKNIVFNLSNFSNIITVLTRYLSFSAFEVPYMLGGNTEARLEVIKTYLWMAPFTLFLLLTGWLQVIFYAVCFFIRQQAEGWARVRLITVLTYFVLFASFFFSIKGPSSHTFYLLLPLVLFYSFYCYAWLVQLRPAMKKLLAGIIISGFVFHAGLGLYSFHKRSLYIDRDKVVRAINEKDYTILGRRRADDWGYGY